MFAEAPLNISSSTGILFFAAIFIYWKVAHKLKGIFSSKVFAQASFTTCNRIKEKNISVTVTMFPFKITTAQDLNLKMETGTWRSAQSL